MGTHVPDIEVKNQGQTSSGNSSLVSKSIRKDVLLELMEVSKALQETIYTSTIRKRNVDGLIKMLPKEKEADAEEYDSEEEEEICNEEEEQSASE